MKNNLQKQQRAINLKKYSIYVLTVVFLLISSSQVYAKCLLHNPTGHCILFDDKTVGEQINDAVVYVSRCGVAGEGILYVRNKTRTTKYFKINGLIDGSYGTPIAPGEEVKGKFCNRDMVGVEISSTTECGGTYLGQSKTVRAYDKEVIDLMSNGFKFHVHDILDPIQRISGLTLTLVAENYGIDPEVLAILGVREADIISTCRNGNPGCLYKIYKYLPQELKLKVQQDNCLRNKYVEEQKIVKPPIQGYPPGYGMKQCWCWPNPNPVPYAPEPKCQSGYVLLGACPGVCPPGGIPYGYVCQ